MRRRVRLPIWCVMAAIALAAVLLLVVKPYWPGWVARYESWQRSRLVLAQLEGAVTPEYPSGVGLGTLLETVQESTRSGELPSGIPIYIDPIALQEAGATLKSPVKINVQDRELATALRSVLGQYGLDFYVVDGTLQITGMDVVARLPARMRPRRSGVPPALDAGTARERRDDLR